MKRHLIMPMHFDTSSEMFDPKMWGQDNEGSAEFEAWKTQKRLQLAGQYGSEKIDRKVQDFVDLGRLPFSIISYHNLFFQQARDSFVLGSYYPALTALCALGERILNHLILDLRSFFDSSQHDKKVHKRSSIDDWGKAIRVLDDWGVFQTPEVLSAFPSLALLRHRSLHFNLETTNSVRGDALDAHKHMSIIVEEQFGFPWKKVISGTKGAFFLRENAEQEPFFKHYYLPVSPRVSPYYSVGHYKRLMVFLDWSDDPSGEGTDQEFSTIFEAVSEHNRVPSELPPQEGVSAFVIFPDGVKSAQFAPRWYS